jgi:2-C-methyl-D-erythritol 4-phosphate cytidylyltransferase
MTTYTDAPSQARSTAAVPRCHILIPSAGVGLRALRAGEALPKQYQRLEGVPMVVHTTRALDQVDVALASAGQWQAGTQLAVVSPDDGFWQQHVAPMAPAWQATPVGGASRAESVMNGLECLRNDLGASACDWVLVHDAARCLVQAAAVHTLIAACVQHGRGGLLAQPVPDTIKVARQDMLDAVQGAAVAAVADTTSRAGKWLAQTPQLFKLGSLLSALHDAHDDELAWPLITDEASALERMGQSPLLVASGVDNFKVTYPNDFELARVVLRGRQP